MRSPRSCQGLGLQAEHAPAPTWKRAFTAESPSIVAAVARLGVDSIVLDGEAVCLRDDGHPDFHALRSNRGCRRARLIAFDLLGLNGEDLRRLPLHERRTRLAGLLTTQDDALWFSDHVHGSQGEALFRYACAMNLEGIVSKRTDTPYRSGPFANWRKIKNLGYSRL